MPAWLAQIRLPTSTIPARQDAPLGWNLCARPWVEVHAKGMWLGHVGL